MVAPIGSRPPPSSTPSTPSTKAASTPATASTGYAATSGFDAPAASSKAAQDFKGFLGEAKSGKGAGAEFLSMFGGSDANVAKNVKAAADKFDSWLAANPNATPEQVSKEIAQLRSDLGTQVISDKNFDAYLFSRFQQAMKPPSE